MTEKDFIPITETPYVSKLAKDYLLGKEIGINSPLVSNYNDIAEKAKSKEFNAAKRTILVNALLEQYKKDNVGLNEDSKVYQNIQSLKESKTFTFTTGQQIHIFLGPLFFIYKIQSLLRHVKNFNKENNEFTAVPVFWMASEDHDLEEINYVKLYGETFTWDTEAGNAVGRIFCKGLPELINKIEERADKTEENRNLYDLFRKHYLSNRTLAAATRSLLHEIFEEDGLIILDPDDKTLKQSFNEVAQKEISEQLVFNDYNEQNAGLKKAGYEARVNAQETNYFWLENNKRVKLKIKDNKIIKNDSGDELKLETLFGEIDKLSPNVITRPIYQETVLPNLLYIGGSAEIEYWLPLQKAFKKLGIQFPALLQRDSVISVTKKNIESIEKSGFQWNQLFESEIILAENFNKNTDLNNSEASKKVDSIRVELENLSHELKEKEIKSGIIFKEIHEVQKGLVKLSNLIKDEELKLKKSNPVLDRVLKIKEKVFEKRQERELYVVGNPTCFTKNNLNTNEIKAVLKLQIE